MTGASLDRGRAVPNRPTSRATPLLTAPDAIVEEGFDILEKTIGQVLEDSTKAA